MEPSKESKEQPTSIGGQALIEGIMMRGPRLQAIVVRNKDELITKTDEVKLVKDKYPVLGWVFIRGVVNFVNSMSSGMSALMYSADNIAEDLSDETSKFDEWMENKLGPERAKKAFVTISLVLGIAFSIVLFMLLPTMLAGIVTPYIPSNILKNLFEGVIRITIFLLYMWLATKLNDIKRMWGYHGAEHKTIHCYEKGLELTLENVKAQPKTHPRCGTSFLFIVMIVSILVFSVTSWSNVWIRIVMRLLLLPVVVSISYEIIKYAGSYDNLLTREISAPGKALQKLTTQEPDDEMIEVAILAMTLVIPENRDDAKW